jgi:cell division protein FtsZ
MGTATSTFQGDIKITGKLDVGTIDPVYTIGGVKYATYGASTVGITEEVITKSIDPDAKVKFGAVIDEDMGEEVRITIVATGFDEANRRAPSQVFAPVEEKRLTQNTVSQPVVEASRPEVRKPLFSPKPAEPVVSTMPEEEEDELDIPAFIRKKMK